ncbi:uncharacterized protein VP01_3556g3 [Puccinia sorghi]|uniref:Uncharacterized protein n=1 Tax=Puccinia sorghi TaxID=27349 RepID=A0A0L6UW85_9BASI|nr:uncharacterized protein VP01_3556g3 [Puccinia sorghi]
MHSSFDYEPRPLRASAKLGLRETIKQKSRRLTYNVAEPNSPDNHPRADRPVSQDSKPSESDLEVTSIPKILIMAPDSHFGTIKLVTDPLDDTNFTMRCFKLQNALAFQNLDDYILYDTAEMQKRQDYAACKKLATTFIRMHLSNNSVACFPACKLHDIHVSDNNMKESLIIFRSTFQLLVEVTTGKLDKKTLETCWIFFLLKRLPPSFSIFRSLKFAHLKTADISDNTKQSGGSGSLHGISTGGIQPSKAFLGSVIFPPHEKTM